jgi:plastocyanin
MKKIFNSKNSLLLSTTFLITMLIILNACSKTSAYDNPGSGGNPKGGGPGTNEVWIQGSAFSPATITVTAGTTITWTNKDAVAHTVTSDGGLFDSGSIASGGTTSIQFNNTGTFPYHCAVHPGMKASVIVN